MQAEEQNWHLLPALTCSALSTSLYLFFLHVCCSFTNNLKTKANEQGGLGREDCSRCSYLSLLGGISAEPREDGGSRKDIPGWPSTCTPSRGASLVHEGLVGLGAPRRAQRCRSGAACPRLPQTRRVGNTAGRVLGSGTRAAAGLQEELLCTGKALGGTAVARAGSSYLLSHNFLLGSCWQTAAAHREHTLERRQTFNTKLFLSCSTEHGRPKILHPTQPVLHTCKSVPATAILKRTCPSFPISCSSLQELQELF